MGECHSACHSSALEKSAREGVREGAAIAMRLVDRHISSIAHGLFKKLLAIARDACRRLTASELVRTRKERSSRLTLKTSTSSEPPPTTPPNDNSWLSIQFLIADSSYMVISVHLEMERGKSENMFRHTVQRITGQEGDREHVQSKFEEEVSRGMYNLTLSWRSL